MREALVVGLVTADGDPRLTALHAAGPALTAALMARDIDRANALFAALPGMGDAFRVEVTERGRAVEAAPVWQVVGPGRSRFRVHPAMWNRFTALIVDRFVAMLPLMLAALDRAEGTGRCTLNLGDEGHVPGLAFCDNRPDYILIPDAIFMMSHGYRAIGDAFAARAIPYAERVPALFWRGASTGYGRDDPYALPRVRLCRLAKGWGERADVGFSSYVQFDADTEATLQAEGLTRAYVPTEHFDRYGLHLDIDGNSNSWPGLMTKLLSGSPVLKVASEGGFRQWYYDRLIPWVNHVPIRADMADLEETATRLLADPALARDIGERGRALARGMTYEAEIAAAAPVVAGALEPLGRGYSAATRSPSSCSAA